MEKIILKTQSLLLEFSKSNGALTFLKSLKTGWVIHKRETLGLCWKMLVPIENGVRNNCVYGENQKLFKYEISDGGVEFVWKDVVDERGNILDVTVTTLVKAEDGGAVWYTNVKNNSPYVIENVFSPYVGDLTRPDDSPFKTFSQFYGSADQWNIYPTFDNHKGDHGILYPTQISGGWTSSPATPFILLRNENQGLYVGIKDKKSELVAWHLQLRPGYDEAISDNVPKCETLNGMPVHVRFSPIHERYILSGEQADLTPIHLEAFEGGWQKGVDVYSKWRDSVSKTCHIPKWASVPHSWLQVHVNSPEGELRYKFKDLPKFAEECKKHGVSAIQLVGWNDGGQDQNNPSHLYDKRLGTLEELKQAIKDCQNLGVKVIIFVKFTWADQGTKEFNKTFKDLAITDPYGNYHVYEGYQYFTATQLLDINTKRLIPMCFASKEYVDICKQEFKKVLELDGDGILYDECQHHGNTLLCFNDSHGHRYGESVFKYDLPFIKQLKSLKNDEEFLISGEACYDFLFEEYALAYFRSRKKMHVPVSRYMRKDALIMTAVSGFNDRNMINQCLMYRYIISYEPFYFKGYLHDFPDTVAYGEKMDKLRTELIDYLWNGEFMDEVGGYVKYADGTAHRPFTRFVGRKGDALVISNYEDEEITVYPTLEKGALSRYRTVDENVWLPIENGVKIPPRSAVVVL